MTFENIQQRSIISLSASSLSTCITGGLLGWGAVLLTLRRGTTFGLLRSDRILRLAGDFFLLAPPDFFGDIAFAWPSIGIPYFLACFLAMEKNRHLIHKCREV